MPTYPQVFHRDLFVTLLEKGTLEYQQSLSKGRQLWSKPVCALQKASDSHLGPQDPGQHFPSHGHELLHLPICFLWHMT